MPTTWKPSSNKTPLTFILSLTFLFLFSGSVYGDDLQDGFDAYKRIDFKTAYKLFLPLAEQGDAIAQFNLGLMYFHGQGVPTDYKEAVKWYRLSVEQGNAEAQFYLGIMYFSGTGVPQDYKEAVKWYRLSAEQGYAEAQDTLGSMYFKGRGGLPQVYKEGVKWTRLAAEQGFAYAQYNLGIMYYDGQGVPEDYVLAHMWFNLSSSNGYKDAVGNRNIVEKEMTRSQIEKAQEMALNWKPTKK